MQVLLNVTVWVTTVSGHHSLINDERKRHSPCATIHIYTIETIIVGFSWHIYLFFYEREKQAQSI